MTVEIVPFEFIKKFRYKASKDRITFANPNNAIWWSNGKGFVCAVISKNTTRFKSDWIVPEFRGFGYYRELFEERMSYCLDIGVSRISAFCLPASLPYYQKHGFEPVNKYNDITFVVWEPTKQTTIYKY